MEGKPMRKNDIRKMLCQACQTRKARYVVDRCCTPCHFRLVYEQTYDQYDIVPDETVHQRWERMAAEYNKLAMSGMRQPQIAALWDMSPERLRRQMQRIRSSGKIKVVNLGNGRRGPNGELVASVTPRLALRNEHGGGRWGVRGCKCDPCVARCKETRAIILKGYVRPTRKLVKELQARVAELETQLAQGRRRK